MSAQDFIVPAYQFAAASATAMLVSVLEKESEITQIKKKKHRVCLNIFIFLKVVFYYLRQLASHKNICSPFQWQ